MLIAIPSAKPARKSLAYKFSVLLVITLAVVLVAVICGAIRIIASILDILGGLFEDLFILPRTLWNEVFFPPPHA